MARRLTWWIGRWWVVSGQGKAIGARCSVLGFPTGARPGCCVRGAKKFRRIHLSEAERHNPDSHSGHRREPRGRRVPLEVFEMSMQEALRIFPYDFGRTR